MATLFGGVVCLGALRDAATLLLQVAQPVRAVLVTVLSVVLGKAGLDQCRMSASMSLVRVRNCWFGCGPVGLQA